MNDKNFQVFEMLKTFSRITIALSDNMRWIFVNYLDNKIDHMDKFFKWILTIPKWMGKILFQIRHCVKWIHLNPNNKASKN